MTGLFCMSCGAPIAPGQRFCTECGLPLDAEDRAENRRNDSKEAFEAIAAPESGSVPMTVPTQELGCESDERTTVIPSLSGADDATTMIALDFVLKLVRGSTGEEYPFRVPAVVGKGTAADVRIDGNNAISRRHARIDGDGTAYYISDLGSTNGTFVGGRQLAPDCPLEVHNGSIIRLADEDFTLLVMR